MKFLLLALVLGVVHGENGELTPRQVNGDWRTLYTGADYMEKISEGGPLRAYYRHLECSPRCKNITLTFYIKLNENCTLITVVGEGTAEGRYWIYAQESSVSTFQVLPLTTKFMSIYNFHVDAEGMSTRIITLIGRKIHVTDEVLEQFYEIVEHHNISKDNIEFALPTDTCYS